MWVKFTRDFDFSPAARNGRVTVAYKAGMTQNVTQECASKAIEAGCAHEVKQSTESGPRAKAQPQRKTSRKAAVKEESDGAQAERE